MPVFKNMLFCNSPIMGVNNVTVLNWIRSMGKSVKAYVAEYIPDDLRHVDIIEMDEMWHFYGCYCSQYEASCYDQYDTFICGRLIAP